MAYHKRIRNSLYLAEFCLKSIFLMGSYFNEKIRNFIYDTYCTIFNLNLFIRTYMCVLGLV